MPSAWICGVLLTLVACGGHATTPRNASSGDTAWKDDPVATEAFATRAPFVAPGEQMTYRLSLHGLLMASFVIVVGDVDEVAGHPVVVVQSGVHSSQLVSLVHEVNDHFTSWIDTATSRSVVFRSEELASADDQQVEVSESTLVDVSSGTFPVRVSRPDLGDVDEEQHVGDAPLFDMNSFLMVLRTWDPPEGTTATADIVRSRYVWRTQVTLAGYEDVVTELGTLPAVHLEGVSRRVRRDGTLDPGVAARPYSLWISDDADRVPLVMVAHTDYGDVKMEIVEYRPGSVPRLGS
ncbi:MAG: DUF3108 domain-containing protein [Kofleriaceae bacterium]|nr:DUF3108 domain-containing protein [Myxococcales bacterium]MCB9560600.1 DUF3108 domain-containing protein [Kofleriaceae bacterium]